MMCPGWLPRALLCLMLCGGCAPAAPGAADLGGPDLSPPPLRGGPLRFPVEDPLAIDDAFFLGMDHNQPPDPVPVKCQSYLGRSFPTCYAGHEGSDFLLAGGFPAMDAGSAFVVAAAAGVVTAVEDGHYDRCHGDAQTAMVSCDGHEMIPNSVTIDHDGGLRTQYYHLMKGSILVRPGQPVDCGQRLARIGSSGRSALPHVHLNLFDHGVRVDPFAGPASQQRSYWNEQPSPWPALPAARCTAP